MSRLPAEEKEKEFMEYATRDGSMLAILFQAMRKTKRYGGQRSGERLIRSAAHQMAMLA